MNDEYSESVMKREALGLDMLTLWDAVQALENMGIVKGKIVDEEFEWFFDMFDNSYYDHEERDHIIESHKHFKITKYLGL